MRWFDPESEIRRNSQKFADEKKHQNLSPTILAKPKFADSQNSQMAFHLLERITLLYVRLFNGVCKNNNGLDDVSLSPVEIIVLLKTNHHHPRAP